MTLQKREHSSATIFHSGQKGSHPSGQMCESVSASFVVLDTNCIFPPCCYLRVDRCCCRKVGHLPQSSSPRSRCRGFTRLQRVLCGWKLLQETDTQHAKSGEVSETRPGVKPHHNKAGQHKTRSWTRALLANDAS